MKQFCPECGKEKGPFLKGFCLDCFKKKGDLVSAPKEIDFEHCKKCGKARIRGKWVELTEEGLEGLVKEKIKEKEMKIENRMVSLIREAEGVQAQGLKAEVTAKGSVDGMPLTEKLVVALKPKDVICVNCSRVYGNYYEATIQVRFGGVSLKKTEDVVLKRMASFLQRLHAKDPLAVIVSEKKQRNGFDVLIGSKRAAKLLAVHLAKDSEHDIKRSFSLEGVDKAGKTKKRFTFCVRL